MTRSRPACKSAYELKTLPDQIYDMQLGKLYTNFVQARQSVAASGVVPVIQYPGSAPGTNPEDSANTTLVVHI